MKTHVLRGSKQEIAESLIRVSGEIRAAIVFIEETGPAAGTATVDTEDIFEEMRPFMVDVHELDDSREAIYTRTDGE